MLAIGHTVISEDIFEKQFVCDLNACKGECCVAGDSGAPLDKKELKILDTLYPVIKPYMTEKGIKAVDKNGTYHLDDDGDYTTTLVSEGAECAFVYYDDQQIAKCAIELAHKEGKLEAYVDNWKKPISCHLYPIRITEYKEYDAVNYHAWHICKPACECGKQLQVPVYLFLKEPLIRKYGEAWFEEVDAVFKAYNKRKQ